MTPEPIGAQPPEPRGMGVFARITGVFLEPSKAFADIAQRPTWLLPLLLMIIAGVAYYTTYGQHVGWARFFQHQAEINPKVAQQMSQMTPDQRAMQAKFAGYGYDGGVIIVTPIALLITSAIVLGIANIMGAGLRFKQVFAIEAWASLPILIRYVLSIVVMFLKNPDDFNLVNPLAFNAAAFMDPIASSKFLYALATAVDVFAIWTLLLGATGVKAASKRISFTGALIAVATPFVLFTLFGATIAGLFS